MAEDFRAGYQILRLRVLCGCSQEELAFGAGISSNYLRQIEHGTANPSLDVLTRIFAYLYTLVTGQEASPALFAIDLLSEDIPMWRYHIVHETQCHPDLGAFPTLGVQVEVQRRGVWAVLDTLHDVTVDLAVLQPLVAAFNHLQLSPLHLRDAVEAIL